MKKTYLSIEEFINLPVIENFAISPDGKKVAYLKKIPEWDKNIFKTELWIYGEDKNIKISEDVNSIKWSQNNDLTYTKKVEEKNQIFVFNNEERQITFCKNGVIGSYEISENFKEIYFLSLEESKILKERKENYGDYYFEDRDYEYPCLFKIDIKSSLENSLKLNSLPKDLKEKEKKDISEKIFTSKKSYINNFIIVNGYIYFSASLSSSMEHSDTTTLYRYSIKNKKTKKYPINAIMSSLYISPKKDEIAFLVNKDWMKNSDLMIFNFKNEKFEKVDMPDINFHLLKWIESGLYFISFESTKNKVYVYHKNKVKLFYDNNESIIDFSLSNNGEYAKYSAKNSEFCDLYLNDKKITNNNEVFEIRNHSLKTVINWKSSDGVEIEGVLSVPLNFDKTKKYPLIVCIHGGPRAVSRDFISLNKIYPLEKFIEKGFLILEPNYRGSIGYGEKFQSLNVNNLGIGDYEDVISGVDSLIEKNVVDKEKVGVMGWSQGGYISAFCSTFSDRFKAISVGAGISDWVSYYYMTDIHQFTKQYLSSTPWDDMEIYRKTSPINYLKNACTPTLIQHGKNDTRVPVNNAYKLYQGLKDMGVKTELMLIEGMRHSPNKPGIMRAIMHKNYMWFCEHILGESNNNFYL